MFLMDDSMNNDLSITISPRVSPPHRSTKSSSELSSPLSCPLESLAVEAALEVARRILGLPQTHKRNAITKAYRSLAPQYHPDLGGDAERMKALIEARNFLLKHTPAIGRPRKYANVTGFVIVDQNGKVRFRGYKTRKEALAALAAMPKSDAPPEDGKRLRLRVIGPSTAERKKAQRLREKERKRAQALEIERYINDPEAGMIQGKYMTQAPHGKGKLITGGYNTAKIDLVDARHCASQGGADASVPARARNSGSGTSGDDTVPFYRVSGDKPSGVDAVEDYEPVADLSLGELDDTNVMPEDEVACPSLADIDFEDDNIEIEDPNLQAEVNGIEVEDQNPELEDIELPTLTQSTEVGEIEWDEKLGRLVVTGQPIASTPKRILKKSQNSKTLARTSTSNLLVG
jgi:hypothetical protein